VAVVVGHVQVTDVPKRLVLGHKLKRHDILLPATELVTSLSQGRLKGSCRYRCNATAMVSEEREGLALWQLLETSGICMYVHTYCSECSSAMK
jgi:hypothetical protein